MAIETLKDLKDSLNQMPDSLLEESGVGYSPETSTDSFEILIYGDEDSDGTLPEDKAEKFYSYPDGKAINKYFRNISYASRNLQKSDDYEGEGFEEPISSEDFPEIHKKSKSYSCRNLEAVWMEDENGWHIINSYNETIGEISELNNKKILFSPKPPHSFYENDIKDIQNIINQMKEDGVFEK